LKIISAVENSLDPQHLQKFNSFEKSLFDEFLINHERFLSHVEKTATVEHQDGICERWKVKLSNSFAVFIDCSTPGPNWGASTAKDYYRSVQVIGFECQNGDFFLSSWNSSVG
jgi:hypothetical protein